MGTPTESAAEQSHRAMLPAGVEVRNNLVLEEGFRVDKPDEAGRSTVFVATTLLKIREVFMELSFHQRRPLTTYAMVSKNVANAMPNCSKFFRKRRFGAFCETFKDQRTLASTLSSPEADVVFDDSLITEFSLIGTKENSVVAVCSTNVICILTPDVKKFRQKLYRIGIPEIPGLQTSLDDGFSLCEDMECLQSGGPKVSKLFSKLKLIPEHRILQIELEEENDLPIGDI